MITSELETMLPNRSTRSTRKKRKKKKKKKHHDDDNDDNEDEDKMYHPSQDYKDDSQVDPEFRPTKEKLRKADEEVDLEVIG